jgi:hypothetical protein
MAEYGGGDEKKPLKSSSKACNPGVADCTDGQRPSNKRVRMKQRAFSTTKSRYNLPQGKKKKEEPVPTNSAHQNVRDLGGNPGQPTYNSGSDRNPAERKMAELKLTKSRKFFGK